MLTSMNIGGVEKSLLSLLASLDKDKYEVTLLLLEKKGRFLKYIPDWVKVEEASWFRDVKPVILEPPQQTVKELINNKRFLKLFYFVWAYYISKYFNYRYAYYKTVLNDIPQLLGSYDTAISYQGPTDIIDFFIANKVVAKRRISWVHFDVSKHKVNKRLYKKLYKNFNEIFVVSKEAKEKLEMIIPETKKKTKVFHNVIQKDLIWELAQTPIEFDQNYTGFKILTVGRLSKEKGQDLAIEVLTRLRNEGYDVRWYCIGEGNARSEYERMICDNGLEEDFLLFGAKTNPYPYMLQSDIYVQPSRHEGYCITLAEAKCLQKPIVTTNFTGAYEQIKDGYNGLVVERNVELLYKKIKFLLDDQSFREKLVSNLSSHGEKAIKYFDEKVI